MKDVYAICVAAEVYSNKLMAEFNDVMSGSNCIAMTNLMNDKWYDEPFAIPVPLQEIVPDAVT